MADENGSILPTVHEEIKTHMEMLLKAFDGYFATRELKFWKNGS